MFASVALEALALEIKLAVHRASPTDLSCLILPVTRSVPVRNGKNFDVDVEYTSISSNRRRIDIEIFAISLSSVYALYDPI